MDKIAIYAAVNTKIRAMEGKFLTEGDYESLLEKKSVPEIAFYLRDSTFYGQFLKDLPADKLSRRYIEDILKRNMIINMDKLLHYFRYDYKKFISSFYLKYEIEDLKVLAREIFNNEKFDITGRPLSFLGKYSKIEPEKFLKAKTVEELIYATEGSDFFDILKPLLRTKTENLFRFEMLLDAGYFRILENKMKNVSKEDSTILKKWEGMVADLYNIQWIYRGKKFYNISPEELLNYTINFGDKLNFTKRRSMCYTKTLDELYVMAQDAGYGFLFKKEEMSRDIYMERRINRYIYYKLKKLTREYSMSIMQTINYIYSFEFEIRDIISIMESIRYSMQPDQINKFLIKAI